MRRRRKNAGKGYGMIFHGAFGSKADAKKKERKVHGFIRPTEIKGERRYVVMSERKNPIKRKKKEHEISERIKELDRIEEMQRQGLITGAEKFAYIDALRRGRKNPKNPSELLVLGANPTMHDERLAQEVYAMTSQGYSNKEIASRLNISASDVRYYKNLFLRVHRPNPNGHWSEGHEMAHGSPWGMGHEMTHEEITLAPNRTYTLRTNPAISAINPSIPETRAAARQLTSGQRVTIRAKDIGTVTGIVDTVTDKGISLFVGEGHRTRWVVIPFNEMFQMRTNPSAEVLRESFVGKPSDGYTTMNVEGIPQGDYAQLGELLTLYCKPAIGGQVREIRFQKPRPLLVSDTSARQMYFVGGDQAISEEQLALFTDDVHPGMVELGECRRIDYKQRKEHVPDPDIDEWKHEFGEENGIKPSLWYNTGLQQLALQGGDYSIKPEGITN